MTLYIVLATNSKNEPFVLTWSTIEFSEENLCHMGRTANCNKIMQYRLVVQLHGE